MHIVIFGSTYLFSLDSNPIRCVERMWVGLCLHNGAHFKKLTKALTKATWPISKAYA